MAGVALGDIDVDVLHVLLLCLFDRNCVEAMFASVAAMFGHVLLTCVTWLCMYVPVALVQRGKKPCAHLIDTLWQRCWPVSACLIDTSWKRCWHVSHVSLWPNVGVHVSRIAARYLPERLYVRTMHLSLIQCWH